MTFTTGAYEPISVWKGDCPIDELDRAMTSICSLATHDCLARSCAGARTHWRKKKYSMTVCSSIFPPRPVG